MASTGEAAQQLALLEGLGETADPRMKSRSTHAEINDRALGFTGTQRGMTDRQAISFRRLLCLFEWTHFHHGDCVGADAEAHEIAVERKMKIVIHPPAVDSKRAWKFAEDTRTPKPYLERNHDIVDATLFLITAPGEDVEKLRSGTWSTWRYAVKRQRCIWVVLPSGEVVGPQPGWYGGALVAEG